MNARQNITNICRQIRTNKEDCLKLDLSLCFCGWCPLNQDETEFLYQALRMNTRIVEINLRGCLRDNSDSVKSLVMVILRDLPSLQVLNLGNNLLEDSHTALISNALKTNTSLKVLGLRHCKISSQGGKALFESLRYNQTLEELDLSLNQNIAIDRAASSSLAESSLRLLNLSENMIDDAGAKEIAEALRHNKTLEVLHLNGYDGYDSCIGDSGCKQIADALRHNCTLRELHLQQNDQMSDAGARFLELAFQFNHMLEVLDIRNDIISVSVQDRIDQLCGDNNRIKKHCEQLQQRLKFEAMSECMLARALRLVNSKPTLVYTLLKANPELFLFVDRQRSVNSRKRSFSDVNGE